MRTSGSAGAPPGFVRAAAHPVRWKLLAALAESDYRVRELAALTGEPQNLASYHLRLLRAAGLVTTTRSTFDGRDSYYHLDLSRCAEALTESAAALHPALAPAAPRVTERSARASVLFVCTGNSARSPIAEALLRHHTGGRAAVTSAGSAPKPELHPNTITVLHKEFGIDTTPRQTRHVDSVVGRHFDRVITMCDKAREVCPDFGTRSHRAHWSLPDPSTGAESERASYPAFKEVAQEIDTRIRYLLPVLNDR